MSTTTEHFPLSLERTAVIVWSIIYWQGNEQARQLLEANKPEALVHGQVRIDSLTILSEKYSRCACELSGMDAELLGAAIARITAVTASIQAQEWEFDD